MSEKNTGSQLEAKLRLVEVRKSGSYDPRTEHLDEHGNTLFINRLILEDSPYLLQHAHNPVNWYAWGTEAFEAAARENKPVFLSIGYSTCHWCHVMEVESFDNVKVAETLNKDFISVKMDREQYPDIDEAYMTGVQLMTGQGGWPMSNFLLADGKPFFGGTYFPAASFIHLLGQIATAWRDQYSELESSATKMSEAINRILSERKEGDAIDVKLLENTIQAISQREDRALGGLTGAPKFPQEPLLLFMLNQVARTRDVQSMGFVSRALDGMARGGIYDQIAGGFHRYSVDSQWLVPHFEKMLYNQSQLGLAYARAWQITGNDFFQRICRQTLDYVIRDMQISEGGFYSATDADSEGVEGTFFLWSIEQLEEVLELEELDLIVSIYGPSVNGNFEGSNILHLSKSLAEHAQNNSQGNFYEKLDGVLEKLYKSRELRIHPLRDDKLIVAWTAAMISTLAEAAHAMNNKDWLAAAEKGMGHIVKANLLDDGRLKRINLNGEISINGQLEDYANSIFALLSLFDITSKSEYLQTAARLMDVTIAEFWDEQNQGFYLSPEQQTGPQLTRSRNASDGAILSAVAVALDALVLLWQRSYLIEAEGRELFYRQKIDGCIASLVGHINDNPISHPSLLSTLANYQQGSLSAIQYAGKGLARLEITKSAGEDSSHILMEIAINLHKDWHVSAPQEADGHFVPMKLGISAHETHWQISEENYPFSRESLNLEDGNTVATLSQSFLISATLSRTQKPADALAASAGLTFTLQLCSENHCLLPETLNFRI